MGQVPGSFGTGHLARLGQVRRKVTIGFLPFRHSTVMVLAASSLRSVAYFTFRLTPRFSKHPLGNVKLSPFAHRARRNSSAQISTSGTVLAACSAHHKGTMANKSSSLCLRGARCYAGVKSLNFDTPSVRIYVFLHAAFSTSAGATSRSAFIIVSHICLATGRLSR